MSDERGAVEAGVRRVPELDLGAPLPESDPRLVARIRDEIAAGGPMPFSRFMAIALFDPEAGYYTAQADPAAVRARGPGRAGDFLTAPESHPIFGWAIARRLEAVWEALGRPERFVVREHGAASGALAVGVLDGLRRSGSDLLGAIRYQPVEVSAAALEALDATLEAAGLGGHAEPPTTTPEPGAILANELLDAQPVHRVEGAAADTAEGPLLERYVVVGPDGAFTTELGPPSTPALAARLEAEGVLLEPGQAAEVCLAIDDWVATAAAALAAGLLLVIDYGYPAGELYAPARGSTLRAYHRHRVHDDPLVAIGRQDLTAHVDLTAVERAATTHGLALLRRARQAEYLASLGLGGLLVGLQTEPGATLERYLAARSAVVRMLDPRATGGFAVLEFGRGLPA
jgi:SAM-dependent MidA family methyltransferase